MEQSAWQKIKLVLLDVDGVLNDGTLLYTANGEIISPFNVRDGFAMVQLQKCGIPIGIITGRYSPSLSERFQHLNIKIVYQGTNNKLAAYKEILAKTGLQDSEVVFMGDDIPDLPVLKQVGIPAAPQDAAPEVLAVAKYIAPCPGGRGAVRALAETILKAQGKWETVAVTTASW